MDVAIEKKLLKVILQKQAYDVPFSKVVLAFEKKLAAFDPVKSSFEIGKYFIKGKGHANIKKDLLRDGLIQNQWLKSYTTKSGRVKTDFKGLYVFLNGQTPFYVGISKGVISRIIQHLKGHSHHTSTLAYNIGLELHYLLKKERYGGKRKSFDFKTHVGPAKEFLRKQRLAFLPVSNNEELYLFEIYCAMHLQCRLNKFETH